MGAGGNEGGSFTGVPSPNLRPLPQTPSKGLDLRQAKVPLLVQEPQDVALGTSRPQLFGTAARPPERDFDQGGFDEEEFGCLERDFFPLRCHLADGIYTGSHYPSTRALWLANRALPLAHSRMNKSPGQLPPPPFLCVFGIPPSNKDQIKGGRHSKATTLIKK